MEENKEINLGATTEKQISQISLVFVVNLWVRRKDHQVFSNAYFFHPFPCIMRSTDVLIHSSLGILHTQVLPCAFRIELQRLAGSCLWLSFLPSPYTRHKTHFLPFWLMCFLIMTEAGGIQYHPISKEIQKADCPKKKSLKTRPPSSKSGISCLKNSDLCDVILSADSLMGCVTCRIL